MGKPGAIFPFLHAVTTWIDGPAELRHLLLTLCVLCNHETRRGIYGQRTIAKAMGRGDDDNGARTVRRLLDRLEKHPTSPIKVHRRFRMRADGKGRTSDEWTLELTAPTGHQSPIDSNDQPDTSVLLDPQPSGHQSPLGDGTGPSDQPDTKRRPTGHERQNQPDTRVRGSACVDQHLYQHVFTASADASPVKEPTPSNPKVKTPKPSKAPKAQQTQPQPPGTHELKLHFVAEFERVKGETPQFGKQWSRAMKAFGELVTTHGLERAKLIVGRGIADNFRKPLPWRIAQDSVMYQGEQVKGFASRKGAPPQPGTNAHIKYDDDEIYPTKKTGTDDSKGIR